MSFGLEEWLAPHETHSQQQQRRERVTAGDDAVVAVWYLAKTPWDHLPTQKNKKKGAYSTDERKAEQYACLNYLRSGASKIKI